jgi:hypothetical protein
LHKQRGRDCAFSHLARAAFAQPRNARSSIEQLLERSTTMQMDCHIHTMLNVHRSCAGLALSIARCGSRRSRQAAAFGLSLLDVGTERLHHVDGSGSIDKCDFYWQCRGVGTQLFEHDAYYCARGHSQLHVIAWTRQMHDTRRKQPHKRSR